MKIDKGWGCWDLINPTRLDDIAYYLLVQDYVKDYKDSIPFLPNMDYEPPNQSWINYKYFSELKYSKYYNNANNILRKEKLVKLKEIQ